MEYQLRGKFRNKTLISLAKISNGVKEHQSDIILVAGVILISLLSFAMGYIMAKAQAKEPIKIENSQPTAGPPEAEI